MKTQNKKNSSIERSIKPKAKVLGKYINPEDIESPALRRVLRELADDEANGRAWDKNWHKHDKCCTGFLFSQ